MVPLECARSPFSIYAQSRILNHAALGSPTSNTGRTQFIGQCFEYRNQLGGVDATPKRRELVAALKKSGPVSIYALAQGLDRHYRNVHKDVTALMEWTVIEKNDDGLVLVPWDEIDVRWPLQDAA